MDKNSIIGFILIGAILFGFTWWQSRNYRQQAAVQAQIDSVARVERLAQQAKDSAARAELEAKAQEQGVSVEELIKPASVYKDTVLNSASRADAELVALENDKVKVVFSTKGAQPYSVTVKDYKKYGGDELVLINPEKSLLGITLYAGEKINTKDFVFNVVAKTDSTLVMALPFSNGGFIQQKFTLPAGSYKVADELSFIGMDSVIPKNVSVFDIDWGAEIPRLEKGYKNEKQYSKLDVYFPDAKKPEELGRGGRDVNKVFDSKIKWIAYQQQFFSAIFTAENGEFSSGEVGIKFAQEDDPGKALMTGTSKLRCEFEREGSDVVKNFSFYFGPNHFQTLKDYDLCYEKIIPLGGNVVGWISRLIIIPSFNFLHRFIANYGLIILIMTILLKIVISPLTIKSYMSSAKMQAVKPEIDKINEKYPKQEDAMKKQQATMDLYKRAGISPAGGCLPMLLQFPILWAMFRFFPASIELRQQGFLWAEDLSAYDSILDLGFRIPLYGDHVSLFALLMAVTMFFYSKMSSSQMSSDPNMAGMKFMTVWMMPIMMLFICNNLSSGLSYYYFLSNLLTMAQTWAIKKWFVKPDEILAKLKASQGKPLPKSKWQLRLEEAQKMQKAQAAKNARR